MLKETQWISFFSDCSDYILDEQKTFNLRGNKELAECSGAALSSSKKLYSILCSESASVEEVKNAILKKKKAAHQFLNLTGVHWPF